MPNNSPRRNSPKTPNNTTNKLNMINFKTTVLREGTMLYHGTVSGLSMPNDIPSTYGGSWFARLKRQAIYWAIRKMNSRRKPVVYTYRVKKDVTLMRLDDRSNMQKLSWSLGYSSSYKYNGSFNGHIASRFCGRTKFNGWFFPTGQTQVMLCHPSEFLEFVKEETVHMNQGNTPFGALMENSFMYVNKPVEPMKFILTNARNPNSKPPIIPSIPAGEFFRKYKLKMTAHKIRTAAAARRRARR